MKSSPITTDAEHNHAGLPWRWLVLAVLICLAAITQQSLWNDEALTAIKAMQPTLSGWWQGMMADKASDLQMPLYMIWMWGFAKIFGASEWALRGANIPWFVMGIAALMKALRKPVRIPLAIVFLLSPFAWYYLSEARPYAMQLGASLMIVAALYRLDQDNALPVEGERGGVALFFFGVIALSGSSLLGMIWAGAACLSMPVLLSWRRLAKLVRAHTILCAVSACVLAGLVCYYLWTLKQGARASDVGRTDARNLVFILYELLGLGGLGPGRLEIRQAGLKAFMPYAKSLVVYGVLIGDLLILGIWRLYRTQPRRRLAGLVLVIALPMAVLLAAGYVKEFRVLGRHFTPLMVVILFVLGLGLQARWSRAHWASKSLACGFLILSLASCLSFRLAARHERDDYLGAAGFATAALQAGQGVWWNAGREGAVYYQVPLADHAAQKDQALWLMNPVSGMLSSLPQPDIIVLSKPDVYDAHGVVAEYLGRGGYFKLATMPAFTVWQLKGDVGNPSAPKLTGEFY